MHKNTGSCLSSFYFFCRLHQSTPHISFHIWFCKGITHSILENNGGTFTAIVVSVDWSESQLDCAFFHDVSIKEI